MPQNPIDLTKLAELTQKRITGSRTEWEAYLSFTGRLYRQSHIDQLLIYAHRPNATACADIGEWNTKGRWVKRGTKGIALIDSSSTNLRLRYVFDLSDTHAVKENVIPYIWKMEERYQAPIMLKLAERHGIDSNTDLHDFLENISEAVTNDILDDYLADYHSCRGDSLLGDLDEHSASVFFRDTVIDSVRTCIAARCGVTQDDFATIRFQHLGEFNTFETATCLCEAVSNISESILRELEREVRKLHQEEGIKHEREHNQSRRTDLLPERGLFAAQRNSENEGLSARILRREAPEVSDGAQKSHILRSGAEERAGGASGGDRPAGQGDVRPADLGHGETTGGDGGIESLQSDGLGGTNEQHPSLGAGDDPERPDLRLTTELPSVEEQLDTIMEAEAKQASAFVISQQDIDDILCYGSGVDGGKYRIALQYQKGESTKQRAAFLKNEYGWSGQYSALSERNIDEGHDVKGIHITMGSLTEPDVRVDISWTDAAKRIGQLIAADRYLTQQEKEYLPHYEEDMEKRRLAVKDRWEAEHAEPDRANAYYAVHEGDQVHISGALYDITRIDLQTVVLSDPSFPLLRKELSRSEFDGLIRESAWNNKLISNSAPTQESDAGSTSERDVRNNDNQQELAETGSVSSDKHMKEEAPPFGELTHDNYHAYLILKEQNPDSIVAIRVGSYYEIYGDDITTAKSVNVYQRDLPNIGTIDFTVFQASMWVYYSHRLWKNGNNIVLFEPNETDGYEEVKRLNAADYIPIGRTLLIDSRSYTVESVNFVSQEASLRDIDYAPADHFPLIRVEPLDFVRSYVEEQQPEPTLAELFGDAWTDIANNLPHADEQAHDDKTAVEPVNYCIIDDQLGVGGPKTKYAANIAAIRTLKDVESQNRLATAEEQKALSQYVGWGGVSLAFDQNASAWSKEYFELKDLLNEKEYAAARESTLTAFYTPPVIIKAMYQALENMGFQTGNIIDPGCGDGNFIGLLPQSMNRSHFYGIEIDSISGRIAQQLYQKASIAVEGYEKTKLPDSFFDLAIGNVPFGQYKVADRKYDKLNFNIHDYFFAKTLDKVRPGGIVAFITSSFTMDKQTSNVRKYIAQRAELIGAVRLPNNAFKANAGTDVVSDILFLQKRDRVMDIEPEWTQLDRLENGYLINRYFVEHPEMVLGTLEEESTQFGMKLTCAPIEDANLAQQLNTALSNLQANYTASELGVGELDEEQADVIPADPDVRNYSYCLYDGSIFYRENSIMTRKDITGVPAQRIRGMIEIRDCIRTMIDEQLAACSDEVLTALQQSLDHLYNNYVKSYDRLNSRGNKLAFEDDSSYPLLCSLEIFDEEGNFKDKADIFTKRTIGQETQITHVDTAAEALAVSIGEKAKVDMPFMAELLGNGITESDIAVELRGVIFLNPETEQWETADEYLSGNVRTKLLTAQHYNELQDGKFSANVDALAVAQPIDLEASEIDVHLGATWIEPEYMRQFMFELFEPSPFIQRRMDVIYSSQTDAWYVKGKSEDATGTAPNITYGTKRINGYELLQDALNLRSSQIYDIKRGEDGEKRVLNTEETIFAQQKQDAIKQAFQEWIFRDPDRREHLVRKYNDKFNAIVPRHYDGSHIRFVGMNPEIKLDTHQVNGVARGLYGGNTLLAYCVGAGKTFTMAAIAMESRRLGLCQKSMFVVPNHLIQDWCGEFLRLYPSANLLMTTEKDFQKANRKKFCARIATGDYDAVIIGHSQFEKISVSPERQEALLNRQLDEILMSIDQLKEEDGERFTIKQMEALRKQLENRLERLSADEKKDIVVNFEELGVDKILVDEAHGYKNLFLYTKMRNVAGIAQTEAQKSTDLYNKCQFLDELTGGKGIVFATGTPISNSMTELFTMMRYLQSAALAQLGLSSFDAWASTFGEVVTSNELAPEGTTFRPKSRFARFYNLPELMNLWREAADIQTADMLNLPVPEAIYHTEVVEPSEFQLDMVKQLGSRADVIRKGGIDSSVDNMLKITNDGRYLALDQRLIDPALPDDTDSKVNRCIDNIYRIWQDTAENKSSQIVFCDLSTPGKTIQMDVVDGVAVMTGFQNLYQDIRTKLFLRGVPEEEIAFIHDAKTQVQKAALFSKVRSGHVRILIGSTAKMGAGTNVQNKLVALHHLDVPWRPSDIEQREGRIIRQKNENDQVHLYKYVTKNTFDAYSWQTIENKQKFIGQIMTGKSSARSCEDIDSTALSYAEVKALATGNPQIKEKMDLEIEVAKLSALRNNHRNEQFRLEDKVLKWLPTEIQQMEKHIEEYNADSALAAQTAEADFLIELEGKTYTFKSEAMATVEVLRKLVPEKGEKIIGSYRGFALQLFDGGIFDGIRMQVKGSGVYSFSLGTDALGNATRLNNIIAKLPDLLERSETELKNLNTQLETSKASLGKPFPQEQELLDKSARLNELNLLLSQDQNEQQQPENENELEME